MNIKEWKFEITLATAVWALIRAFNLWWDVSSLQSRISALENSQVPLEKHAILETKVDYIWQDVSEIKDVLKSTLSYNK